MKRNKAITALISFLLIAIFVTGCSSNDKATTSNTPKSVATAYLQSLKDLDFKEASSFTTVTHYSSYLTLLTDQGISEEDANKITKLLYDFDFTVGKETISEDGKTAEVEVTIKACDYNPLYKSYTYADLTFASKQEAVDYVVDSYLNAGLEKETISITMYLEMRDDAWAIPLQKNVELMTYIGVEGSIANIIENLDY